MLPDLPPHATKPTTPATPSPSPSLPSSPLTNYLRDPWAALRGAGHGLTAWLAAWGPVAAPALLVLAAGIVAGRRWWRRCRGDLLADGARVVTVVPPPTVDPAGAAVLWANLVGLLRPAWRRAVAGQPHLALEYVFDPDGMRIQLWVPGPVPPGLVERAVAAAWPGAHTTTTPAVAPLDHPAGGQVLVAGGQLRLATSEALPLRTDFDADPVRALLAAPAGLDVGQQAVVQVLARPVTGRRIRRARRAGRHLQAGRSTRRAGRLLDLLTDLLTPGPSRSTRRTTGTAAADPQVALEAAAVNRAVVGKLRGPQYETLIRYAVTATAHPGSPREETRAVSDVLRGRAHAVASAFSLYAGHNSYRRARLRRPLPALAARRLDGGDLLSVAELAALAHLPVDEQVPGLVRAGAQAVPPPPGTPVPGPQVKPLGVADAGPRRPVGLAVADARHHVQVSGVTGSGKTTFLAGWVLADAAAGRGQVVIDGSKGDLIADLLDRLPAEAAGRVVLFDAADPRPPCLNPLDGPPDVAVDNLVSVFSRVFAASWGPRTDDILRAACLTLTTTAAGTGRAPTLLDLPNLLVDPDHRARLVAGVTDPVLRGFWTWYEQLSDPARAQYIAPLMNKLRALLLRPFVRNALAAGPSTVDLRKVLDGGGLLLARLPKGVLGADTARLVGSLIVAATWQATTARAATPQHRRKDASLVIDECQNFLHLPYPLEDMLAEARGYRLSIVLAHQHLAQLGPDLAEGISANARTKVIFAVSPEDARRLARHTHPRLTEHDLAHLSAYHAAARLVVAGAQAPAFTLATTPLGPVVPGRARLIRAAARAHTRPKPGSRDRRQPPGAGRAVDPRRAA